MSWQSCLVVAMSSSFGLWQCSWLKLTARDVRHRRVDHLSWLNTAQLRRLMSLAALVSPILTNVWQPRQWNLSHGDDCYVSWLLTLYRCRLTICDVSHWAKAACEANWHLSNASWTVCWSRSIHHLHFLAQVVRYSWCLCHWTWDRRLLEARTCFARSQATLLAWTCQSYERKLSGSIALSWYSCCLPFIRSDY